MGQEEAGQVVADDTATLETKNDQGDHVDDDDDDGVTTTGRLLVLGKRRRTGEADQSRCTRFKREMLGDAASLLKKMSQGEQVDLDALDGISDDSILSRRRRQRTVSGFVGLTPQLDVVHQNRSTPSTPTFGDRSRRRRNFSMSDAVIPKNRGLLGSFAESALNGRLEPVLQLDGFNLQLAASGASFVSPLVSLPVRAFFFDLNTTGNSFFPSAPVPYLGKCSLDACGMHGYRIPRKGNLQATLFNPQGTVVKVFLTSYDVDDMPPHSRTFIRHVWKWEVAKEQQTSTSPKHLAHLIHYRILSGRRGRVFLHTDVRLLFSQNATLDALELPTATQVSNELGSVDGKGLGYRLCDTVELPDQPRYSPIK